MADSWTAETIQDVMTDVVHPSHFYVGRTLGLEWQLAPRETIPWELFQGQLLDARYCREERTFLAWNLFRIDTKGRRSSEPLLSVKYDQAGQCLHVTRAILCHAWEGYQSEDHVFLSRPTSKWVRELVGTVALTEIAERSELRRELAGLLFRAVVGKSRLPLTSLEAPLPDFSLGNLGYCFQPQHLEQEEAVPLRSTVDLVPPLVTGNHHEVEQAKRLELLVRATPAGRIDDLAAHLVEHYRQAGRDAAALLPVCRAVFQEIALSPYTDFVDKFIAFLTQLYHRQLLTAADVVDYWSYLLRHLGRHLTAYDLVIFHHQGANYPDALLLDAVLREYLGWMERHPGLWLPAVGDDAATERIKRVRRRALRQGWLPRRRYEGHRVPDAPTSPGENLRVLPSPFRRVPEEQITAPAKRKRQLFEDDPLTRHLGDQGARILAECWRDLRQPAELRELGLAVFLDRPLGVFKQPTEPDNTVLLTYEAFSRAVAQQRLPLLATEPGWPSTGDYLAMLSEQLHHLEVAGVPLRPRSDTGNVGIVSLDDAFKVADDFLLLRTTRRAVTDFFAQFDRSTFQQHCQDGFPHLDQRLLIVRASSVTAAPAGRMLMFDANLRPRLEWQIDASQGYIQRWDRESPRTAPRVTRVWPENGPDAGV